MNSCNKSKLNKMYVLIVVGIVVGIVTMILTLAIWFYFNKNKNSYCSEEDNCIISSTSRDDKPLKRAEIENNPSTNSLRKAAEKRIEKVRNELEILVSERIEDARKEAAKRIEAAKKEAAKKKRNCKK